MPYAETIATVRRTLLDTFAEIDRWFDRDAGLRGYRSRAGGWTIDEVLEHVTLTNHFLMLTLRKWVEIALRRVGRTPITEGESDLGILDVVGQRGSFGWVRPEHMEPTGDPAPEAVRETMREQCRECLKLLERMRNGEGALCRVTMTVNDLGKIDLYQWLYFIAMHARRHLQQLEAIEREATSGGGES
jgi:hypothetical protein